MAIPIEYLQACFDYDPKTGVLRWKARPREHFRTERGWKIFNSAYAGGIAGSPLGNGYLCVPVTVCDILYRPYAHRILWALATGAWPADQLDHRNGVRDDNRLSNLREATNAENRQNRKRQSNNKSGLTGVCWSARDKKWVATIQTRRKRKSLGYFDDKAEANETYLAAKAKYHTFHPAAVER